MFVAFRLAVPYTAPVHSELAVTCTYTWQYKPDCLYLCRFSRNVRILLTAALRHHLNERLTGDNCAMQLSRNSSKQPLWNQPAATDAHPVHPYSVIEDREPCSVEAVLRGPRVGAKEQLKLHLSADSLEASRLLIESSGQLLEQSHRLIVKTENALVCSRVSRKKPN